MKKRYQIFISSTFSDLEKERKAIMEAILSLDCFPTGMEMFPASDSQQFEYIKSIIDESDYYILVMAGRYGSEAEDGKSYTEKEFEYAKEKGIPILAFVMKNLENIPLNKTDQKEKKKKKLEKFRNIAMDNRLAKYWDDYKDLKYEVHDSLSKIFKMNPRVGWIRGNIKNNEQLLRQLNETRQECDKLREKMKKNRKQLQDINNNKHIGIASKNEKTILKYYHKYDQYDDNNLVEKSIEFTWNEIFILLGMEIYKEEFISTDQYMRILEWKIFEKEDKQGCIDILEDDVIRIQIQLDRLDLIVKEAQFFSFSEDGRKTFYNQIIEKSNDNKQTSY
jgi:vacuolar-type H+-ATPase subunit I/STV1